MKKNRNNVSGIEIPDHVLEVWEKWPRIWRQIDPSIIIDLNDHKITHWEQGYDWPIVVPGRDNVGSLLSWRQKLKNTKSKSNNRREVDISTIYDRCEYRSVFCCRPVFECKQEKHYSPQFELSRNDGLTFTEYNILEMFVFLEKGEYLDKDSICLCNGSFSKNGFAITTFRSFNDCSVVTKWDHRDSGLKTSIRHSI